MPFAESSAARKPQAREDGLRVRLLVLVLSGVAASGWLSAAEPIRTCRAADEIANVQRLGEQLNWEAYWSAGQHVKPAGRAAQVLLFWNEAILGYCSRQFDACGVYDRFPAGSNHLTTRFTLEGLSRRATDAELMELALKRLRLGLEPEGAQPPLVDARLFSVPREAGRSDEARVRRSVVEAEKSIAVRACRVPQFDGKRKAPTAIRERRIGESADELVAWWRHFCEVESCGSARLLVPYYSDEDSGVPVLLIEPSRTTLYMMVRAIGFEGIGWAIGSHNEVFAPLLRQRLEAALAREVRLGAASR